MSRSMPVIDSLLALQQSQRASALVLALNDVPRLEVGDGSRALSMPPLDASTMAALLDELGDAQLHAELSSKGEATMRYRPQVGPWYDVRLCADGPAGSGLTMTFRSESAPPCERAPAARGRERVVATPRAPTGYSATSLVRLLEDAVERGAEDVILSAGSRVRVRRQGKIERAGAERLDESELTALLDGASRASESLQREGSGDFGLMIEGARHRLRFRANVFRHASGLSVVLRPIRRTIPTLRELDLPEEFKALAEFPHGLVLLTGPAGSGKSTTLVALVEHVNRTRERHVITLEDPIEYEYTPDRSLIHQREVGEHVESFHAGLRAALRESPDIIVVGEMRDPPTIAAALTAAETGHLVLSTLHAGTTAMAVERVVGAFAPHQQGQVRMQLAGVLRAVIAQALLPGVPPRGRVPVYERLMVNPAVATKIREDRCHQLPTVLHAGRGDGMMPFEATLAERVNRREISWDVAMAASTDTETLAKLVHTSARG